MKANLQVEIEGCGCCGRPKAENEIWCVDCKEHVAVSGALWNRTYLAQFGEDCPFQDDTKVYPLLRPDLTKTN